MPPDQHTEAGVVADLVRGSVLVTLFEQPGYGKAMVFPDRTIRAMEFLADSPRRKRAAVKLLETKSFIDYVNAHKLKGVTHVFGQANEAGGGFQAIVDFHAVQNVIEPPGTGSSGVPVATAPGWGEHIVDLALVPTPEWKRWLGANERLMDQESFAEFIEDNLTDIVEPDAADLLETAQLLTGKKGVTFKSGKNLKNGAIDFQYSEQIEASSGRRDDSMKVPDHFVLGLCPFIGGNGVKIKARLRFRISDSGKLSFLFILDHPDEIVQEAFEASRDEIESKTGLSVHMGTGSVVRPKD